jgi:hypothetical protein
MPLDYRWTASWQPILGSPPRWPLRYIAHGKYKLWGRGLAPRPLGPAYLGFHVSSGIGLTGRTVNRFPDPAASNVVCGFPALRSPVGFTARPIHPQGQEQLSRMGIVSDDSRYRFRDLG